MASVRARRSPAFVIDIPECIRCGLSHTAVPFVFFDRLPPLAADNVYANCPENGAPILGAVSMTIGGQAVGAALSAYRRLRSGDDEESVKSEDES